MNCVGCGAKVTGKFCSNCGEQVLNPELRSLSHMAKDLIEDLTSVDGKLKVTYATISDFYVTFYDQITLQAYSAYLQQNIGILFPEYLENKETFEQLHFIR